MTFDLDNWLLGSSCHVLDVLESSHGHNRKKLLPKWSVCETSSKAGARPEYHVWGA